MSKKISNPEKRLTTTTEEVRKAVGGRMTDTLWSMTSEEREKAFDNWLEDILKERGNP